MLCSFIEIKNTLYAFHTVHQTKEHHFQARHSWFAGDEKKGEKHHQAAAMGEAPRRAHGSMVNHPYGISEGVIISQRVVLRDLAPAGKPDFNDSIAKAMA